MLPSFLQGPFAALGDHLVYSSRLYTDLRSRVTRMEGALIDFTRPPSTLGDERCLAAARLLRPYATSTPLIRVGDAGDGGYVMADSFAAAAALSIGIGGNVSWDLAIAERGIPITQFDPTIAAPPAVVPGATFHRIGLGTKEQASTLGFAVDSLDALLALGHFDTADDVILKIDVEGAEWDALAVVSDYSRYTQVIIEMHDLDRLGDAEPSKNVLAVLHALHATHLPLHVHANNEAPVVPFGTFWFPTVIEVTYLRRDLVSDPVPATRIATHLDSPSNARFGDLSLAGLLTVEPLS